MSPLFEGVALGALLRTADVELGVRLRGARLVEYVLIRTADGYRVVLLVDRRDGQPLAADEALFIVVVAGEKRHSS